MSDTVLVQIPPGELEGEIIAGLLCVSVKSLIARLGQIREALDEAEVHPAALTVVDAFVADLKSIVHG